MRKSIFMKGLPPDGTFNPLGKVKDGGKICTKEAIQGKYWNNLTDQCRESYHG
jgi:hypothetical protein